MERFRNSTWMLVLPAALLFSVPHAVKAEQDPGHPMKEVQPERPEPHQDDGIGSRMRSALSPDLQEKLDGQDVAPIQEEDTVPVSTPTVAGSSGTTVTPSTGTCPTPRPPALRVFRGADVAAGPPAGSVDADASVPFRAAKGEGLIVCATMSAEEARQNGPMKLYADRRWLMGSMGYHRYYGCANLHGVRFTRAGNRTLDIQKADGTWWLFRNVVVE